MKGLTLVEVLVVLLISTFVIGGMLGIFSISTTNYDTNLVSLDLQRQVGQGMSWLIRDIREARASPLIIVKDDNGNDTITFDRLVESGIKYYVTKPNLVLGEKHWQLKREYPVDTVLVRANDITSLSFVKIGNLLKITLGASRTFFSGGKERTLTFYLVEQVQVRNPIANE